MTEDPDALTITFKLHEGVMFHDGTELTADVAKWNYDIGMATASSSSPTPSRSSRSSTSTTIVLHLNYWHNQLLQAIGWVPMFSQAAYEANGGANGGAEWCAEHLVGTGPFTLDEFNRDQSLKWVKNPNYWGGEVYLDGIEVSIIPDNATAAAMMQAGQADIWQSADAQGQSEMEAAGFTLQSGLGWIPVAPDAQHRRPRLPDGRPEGARSGGVRSGQAGYRRGYRLWPC